MDLPRGLGGKTALVSLVDLDSRSRHGKNLALEERRGVEARSFELQRKTLTFFFPNYAISRAIEHAEARLGARVFVHGLV